MATLFALPALLIAATALALLGWSVYDMGDWVLSGQAWQQGVDTTPLVDVGTAIGSIVIAGAYLDAFAALVRHKQGLTTWIRITCELVFVAPIIWVMFGVAGMFLQGGRLTVWAGYAACIGFYIMVVGWIGVIRGRRSPAH